MVCKPFISDEVLDDIDHVVVLHSKRMSSTSFGKSFESFFKPFSNTVTIGAVSGSHLPISYFMYKGTNFTQLLLSEGVFHEIRQIATSMRRRVRITLSKHHHLRCGRPS